MVSRAFNQFKQALKDLEHAEKPPRLGDYEWTCFAAHQAAEKAVKALYQKLGLEVWERSISKLLDSLPEDLKPPKKFIDIAKELYRHYIVSRHPNIYPEDALTD
jgi:HEPN domain-containing protein